MVGVGLGTFVGTMEGAHGELKGDTFRQQARQPAADRGPSAAPDTRASS